MTPVIVDATPQLARAMAPRLRDKDVAEIAAAGWADPAVALAEFVRLSVVARAWLVDGAPACLYGVRAEDSIIGTVGAPWLMSTSAVANQWRLFARHSRSELQRIVCLYPNLVNACDARYATSLRWLRWMGFVVSPPQPYGPNGELFCMFRMDA